jgi:hypothetical protein
MFAKNKNNFKQTMAAHAPEKIPKTAKKVD